MNAEKLREARRRRILENSENRLNKINTPSSNENVSSGQATFVKDKPENNTQHFELPGLAVHKPNVESVIPTVLEDRGDFNLDPNVFSPNVNSQNIKYEITISSITILHISLSQIVLLLLYYDFGFLFGNSVLVPFFLSVVPEVYTSNEQHDSIHMNVLLMLGFPENLAKQISRCIKLTSITAKRFYVYIFCFTCSYAVLTHLYPDFKHISSVNNSIT